MFHCCGVKRRPWQVWPSKTVPQRPKKKLFLLPNLACSKCYRSCSMWSMQQPLIPLPAIQFYDVQHFHFITVIFQWPQLEGVKSGQQAQRGAHSQSYTITTHYPNNYVRFSNRTITQRNKGFWTALDIRIGEIQHNGKHFFLMAVNKSWPTFGYSVFPQHLSMYGLPIGIFNVYIQMPKHSHLWMSQARAGDRCYTALLGVSGG